MPRSITKARTRANEPSATPPKVTIYLTAGEAAQRLRVSVRSLDRFQKNGLLPGFTVGGTGHRRFRADDVDRLLVPAQSLDQHGADLDSFISTHSKKG